MRELWIALVAIGAFGYVGGLIWGLFLIYDGHRHFVRGIPYILFNRFDLVFLIVCLVFAVLFALAGTRYPYYVLGAKRGNALFAGIVFFLIAGYGYFYDDISMAYLARVTAERPYSICFLKRKTGRGAFGSSYLLARHDIGCAAFTERHKSLNGRELSELVDKLNSETR